MIEMRRQKIIRRLLVLRNLEFFNIFWLPICLYVALTSRNVLHWQPYAYGIFLICAILAQGVFLLAPKTSNHLQSWNRWSIFKFPLVKSVISFCDS
jgi:hypothetical protein